MPKAVAATSAKLTPGRRGRPAPVVCRGEQGCDRAFGDERVSGHGVDRFARGNCIEDAGHDGCVDGVE